MVNTDHDDKACNYEKCVKIRSRRFCDWNVTYKLNKLYSLSDVSDERAALAKA